MFVGGGQTVVAGTDFSCEQMFERTNELMSPECWQQIDN